MPSASRFTFGQFNLDKNRSLVTFTYRTDLKEGGSMEWVDTLEFPNVQEEMWEKLPKPLLTSLLQALSLVFGVSYWKIHSPSEIRIEGFALTFEQAQFWNTLYTKGLGEFFYRSRSDFRGLISFPYENKKSFGEPTSIETRPIALLLNGGGKDTIVSAEMLEEHDAAFDVFSFNEIGLQRRVADLIGHPAAHVTRRFDKKRNDLIKEKRSSAAAPELR